MASLSKSYDINLLRRQLKEAGVYQHFEVQVWLRLAFLIAVGAGCLFALKALSPWWAFALIPMLALTCTTAAMLGHEGIHGSFSARRWQNRSLSLIAFPLIGGLSAVYWKHKHDNLHHGHPNVFDTDPDVDIWPMASCKEVFDQSTGLLHSFQRHLQGYAFWPLTLMLGVIMRANSLLHIRWHLRNRRVDTMFVLDIVALVLHYTLWIGGCTLLFGLWTGLAVYAGTWALVGLLLAMIFAPAHIGLPVTNGQNRDWIHQLETTRNMFTPRGTKWFFVGLDYQVEHHLFPKIPHQQLPKAREITRAWCLEAGLPYQEVSYGEALRSATTYVRDAWKTPIACPDGIRDAWSTGATAANNDLQKTSPPQPDDLAVVPAN